MRKFIVLAALLAVSPAWGQCAANDLACRTEAERSTPRGPVVQSPHCPPEYALLAYPGTWTLVCARDLEPPR